MEKNLNHIHEFEHEENDEIGENSISYEEFQRLSYEQRFDYLTMWMTDLMKLITELAKVAEKQNRKREQYAETLSKVEKAFPSIQRERILKNVVKNILGGEFKREKNSLREWVV